MTGIFWPAVVWGFGVSVGASAGLLILIVLLVLLRGVTRTEAAKRAAEIADLSVSALERRNELTEQQVVVLRELLSCACRMDETLRTCQRRYVESHDQG